jgi:hypothetical protein
MTATPQILPLALDCIIEDVGGDAGIDAAAQIVIEDVWQKETAKRGQHLHNGRIFTILSVSPKRLTGRFIDYKTYLAAWHHPEAFVAQPIHSLAISGMITANDHVLIGKRSQVVTNAPGSYEFVPSGGIDDSCVSDHRIDAKRQVITEFQEETGINASLITSITVIALFHDLKNRLYDVCAHVELARKTEPKLSSRHEYEEMFWLDFKAADAFLSKNADNLLGTTKYLWDWFAQSPNRKS